MWRFFTKWYWTCRSIWKICTELFSDLSQYFISPYPILLVIGAYRRLRRRLQIIWLPPKRGRPPLTQAIVDLILDMKRSNPGWGSLTISNELKILGIMVSKTTVLKILRLNGFIPPKTKFVPPSWSAFLKTYTRVWYLDFTTVFDAKNPSYSFSILLTAYPKN